MTNDVAPAIETMSSKDHTVAVVILNWNGGEEILDCLQSVFESVYKAIEVVVVDNGSEDGSTEAIGRRFPQVHFIRNQRNLGFARGSNQGMEWALARGIRYALLLNGDARMDPEMIRELLAAVERKEDAIVACPRMYLGGGKRGANRIWFVYGTVKLWAGVFGNPAFNLPDSPQWDESREMEFASGCCMLIPERIMRSVGLFDEAFFAYCEDVDWSIRIRKAGFRLQYVPTARLWHGSNGESSRKHTTMYRYLLTRNNLWTVRKHGAWFEVLSCLCILPVRSLYRIVRMIAGSEWGTIAAELRGIKDGLLVRTSSQ